MILRRKEQQNLGEKVDLKILNTKLTRIEESQKKLIEYVRRLDSIVAITLEAFNQMDTQLQKLKAELDTFNERLSKLEENKNSSTDSNSMYL